MKKRSDRAEKVLLAVNACIVLSALAFLVWDDNSALRSRLSDYLADRQSVARVRAEWLRIPTSGPWFSLPSGKDTLVIFSDYQCPYCRALHAMLGRLDSTRVLPGIRYRQMPMPDHRRATFAARAAICADKIGEFAPVHAFLMETSEWQEVEVARTEEILPVRDRVSFRRCMASDIADRELALDSALAGLLQLEGTPSVVSRNGISLGRLDELRILEMTRPRSTTGGSL